MDTINDSKVDIGLETHIAVSKIYEEACSTMRHFSTFAKNIRTIAMAQGFVILSAIGFLTKEGQFFISILVGGFGLTLTIIFSYLHKYYHHLALATFEYVQGIEKKYSPKIGGTWVAIGNARALLWSQWKIRFIIKKALYILLSVIIIGMIIFNIFKIMDVL